MKKALLICLIITYNGFSHTTKTIERKINNIEVFSNFNFFSEKNLKPFILAEYVNEINKRLKINKNLKIGFYERNKLVDSIICYKNENNNCELNKTVILFFNNDIDIEKSLVLIEHFIKNPEDVNLNKKKIRKIYESEPSELIKKILKTRIYRPIFYEIPSFKRNISYYYENKQFYFLNDKLDVITSFPNIIDYQTPSNRSLVIILNSNEIKFIPNIYKIDIRTLIIENYEKEYIPFEIKIIGNNILLIEFNGMYSDGRIMCYIIDDNILLQNLEKTLDQIKDR
jgi:hypothetical protein